MSVQDNEANYVQASLQGVDCPTTVNPHGYAAILMAASAMEFPVVILPVKFISFTAKENTDNIRLSWKHGDETAVHHYEIQKGTDGKNFITRGIVEATGSPEYTWVDNTVPESQVYYRVKAVSFDGSFYYSAVIRLKQNDSDLNIRVSPNPVRDGIVNIFLNNLRPGKYYLRLINNAGLAIQSKTLDINAGRSIIQTIPAPANSPKGYYYVQVEGNGLKINTKILIQ